MSNQIRAAAAVVLVVGGVFLSWGRLNKGEVSLRDSANATPEFLAVHADTVSAAATRQSPPTAGADLSAAAPAVAGPVAGTPGSRTETKVAANTSTASAFDSAARNRVASAEQGKRGLVGEVSGVMSGVVTGGGAADTAASRRLGAQKGVANAGAFGTGAGRPDTTPSAQVLAQRAAVQRAALQREEERRRQTLAVVPVAPPAEAKKQASVTERDGARDAATSAAPGRVAGAAAAPSAAPTPAREEVLRHPNAGCYTIQSVSWSPALSPAELAAIPTSFELDTLTATGGPSAGRGLVHPRPESVRSRYEAMFWQPDAGGRATVTMRGAQGSLTLALGSGGTQGIALFSRSGGATSRSLITLSRSACR